MEAGDACRAAQVGERAEDQVARKRAGGVGSGGGGGQVCVVRLSSARPSLGTQPRAERTLQGQAGHLHMRDDVGGSRPRTQIWGWVVGAHTFQDRCPSPHSRRGKGS